MIVRHFLGWVRTAPAGERAEATRALARAFLFSDMSSDDLAATELVPESAPDHLRDRVRVQIREVQIRITEG